MRACPAARGFCPVARRAFCRASRQGEPATLFRSRRWSATASDGRIVHLDGLNLSRAWCWRILARSLAVDDARRGVAENAAAMHLAAGLPHVQGDYMGEHWLATFALLALDDPEAVPASSVASLETAAGSPTPPAASPPTRRR